MRLKTRMRPQCRSAILSSGCAGALLFAGLCEYIFAQTAPPPDVRSATTICEVLKAPSIYRGKLIALRGIYWYGLRQSCPEPLITGSHKWPMAIDIVHSDFSRAGGKGTDFTTDDDSWDHLELFVRNEAKAGRREEIWVTVLGILQATPSYVKKNGEPLSGYGYFGGYPAQLVVKTVLEISIRKRPTYDYGKLLRPVL